MTRSVEIPDEALAEAMDAYYSEGQYGREAVGVAMRAALVAARPYLMPTREQIAEAMHDHQMESHRWRQGCREDVCIGIFLDRADAVMAAFFTGKVAGK